MLSVKSVKKYINPIINLLFIYLAVLVAISTIIIVMEIHVLIILYGKTPGILGFMFFISMLAWIESIYMAFNIGNIYLILESRNYDNIKSQMYYYSSVTIFLLIFTTIGFFISLASFIASSSTTNPFNLNAIIKTFSIYVLILFGLLLMPLILRKILDKKIEKLLME
ncbi:MAG: hypothetical protein AMDU4_FER2C00128G0009 [Ferroplasma sp. Type II]|jgi:hypothetical protein|uniref:hypothetical protein n=1 Tax=Ferroplasma sp. Type II TaxID=261388 RepID=UPI00038965B1|nr:hypothetical protein [Ferroplasma sp. Type II]EQB72797.1 MAG: hypothetical protein AMDU4_FER2C00128G0009 [Ferroplasma sp. Type II]HII83169.1 hypothetical protein [Ferroplasma sp.]